MDIYMQVLRSREDQYNKSYGPIHVTLPGGQEVTVFHIFVVYTQKQQQQQQEQPNDKDYVAKDFHLIRLQVKYPETLISL